MALVSWKTARITRKGVELLERGDWLNDEVITFWLEYFSTAAPPDGLGKPEDVLILDTVVANWMLSEDDPEDLQEGLEPWELPKKRLILVPLADREDKGDKGYQGTHWALLALERHGEELRGSYYDSMGTANLLLAQRLTEKLAPGVKIEVAAAGKQKNASDCGIFTLLFTEALCRDKDPKDVTQVQAEAARKHMASHIWRLAKKAEGLQTWRTFLGVIAALNDTPQQLPAAMRRKASPKVRVSRELPAEPKLEASWWESLAFCRCSRSTSFNLLCTWALLLVFVTASAECLSSTAYGKFGHESIFSVPPKVGWWLMELPVTVAFLFSFFWLPGPQKHHAAPRICAAVMCLHYSYRGWIYPYLLRPHPGSRSNFSLMPALGGWLVTITHGYLNGRWFAEHGTHLRSKSWLKDPRFLMGLLLYSTGFVSLVYHDYLMRELRSTPGPRYRIPHGGFFDYATQAVYFCELWTWLGFFLLSWGPNGLFIFLVSAANLVPRSIASHQWYLKTFGEEYANLGRAYLVPFLW